jgi:threonylcarbamoyladenosine tRNA methylthiotransferase MtaB
MGSKERVLFEKATRGRAMHGFTSNYIRVELPPTMAQPELDNQIVEVTLGDFNHDKTALMAIFND